MAKVGRKTVMTKETLGKLEQALSLDATIEEACFFADINPDTYYVYAKDHPEFSERVKALRQRPVLVARQKVVDDLGKDVRNAQWYLERKKPKEFVSKTEHHVEIDPTEALLKAYGITAEGKAVDDAGQAIKAESGSPEGQT